MAIELAEGSPAAFGAATMCEAFQTSVAVRRDRVPFLVALVVLIGCGGAPAKPAVATPAEWTVPAGWRSETIPFPLGFAPDVAHTGAEELRFPPGFFKPVAPDYWSYAFMWRTTDAAALDAAALGDELTRYFRGLITAVDESKHNVTEPATIVARAVAAGDQFALTAHVLDGFGTGQPVDLLGWAKRLPCGTGAVWVFVLAPATTTIRAELDQLARAATCR